MSRIETESFDARFRTPFAVMGVRVREGLIDEIAFLPPGTEPRVPTDPVAGEACRQIARYVADPDCRFDLPLGRRGTPFQRRVWSEIASIPRGSVRTYGDLARAIASVPRAVGQACGSNPFPLVIPCHRVVSASGLGGFAHHDSGFHLKAKRWLLAHESGAPA